MAFIKREPSSLHIQRLNGGTCKYVVPIWPQKLVFWRSHEAHAEISPPNIPYWQAPVSPPNLQTHGIVIGIPTESWPEVQEIISNCKKIWSRSFSGSRAHIARRQKGEGYDNQQSRDCSLGCPGNGCKYEPHEQPRPQPHPPGDTAIQFGTSQQLPCHPNIKYSENRSVQEITVYSSEYKKYQKWSKMYI